MPALRIVLLNANPLEVGGPPERTLLWVAAALRARGQPATVVPAADRAAVAQALREADVLCVGDLRPTQGELMLAAAIADSRARVVLLEHGFPGCSIGVGICRRCAIRERCADSDRVAIYRRLAGRAERIVYQSGLHREANEAFLGALPERTLVLPPPAVPVLAADAAPAGPGTAVAFPSTNDVGEWLNLVLRCRLTPAETIAAYGTPPALPSGTPDNLRILPPLEESARLTALSHAAALVLLPDRPVPFGSDAATMILSGRQAVLNDNVGIREYLAPGEGPAALARRLADAGEQLVDAVLAAAGSGRRARRAGASASEEPPVTERVLLWAHDLGLGDAINLLPVAQVLAEASGGGLCLVLPARYLDLLRGQVACRTLAHEDFDIERERAGFDLIVETTICRDLCYGGDIGTERWVQVEFARQPNAYEIVHENLLSLLARAGLTGVPRRPRVALGDDLRTVARDRLAAAAIDVDDELVLCVHPGAGAPHKRWPAERFADVCRRARERLRARLVLLSGPGEDALADAVLAAGVLADVVSRNEPLPALAALMSHCTVFVGNDSGLMHLACAVDVPALAVFGPSTEHRWRPTHPRSVVVAARDAEGRRVPDLTALDVDAVMEGLARLLRRIATDPPTRTGSTVVASPHAGHVGGRPGERAWRSDRSGVVVRVSAPDDPLPAVLSACRTPRRWQDLSARHDPALLELLLAAELIVPTWSAPPDAFDLVFPTRTPRIPGGGAP